MDQVHEKNVDADLAADEPARPAANHHHSFHLHRQNSAQRSIVLDVEEARTETQADGQPWLGVGEASGSSESSNDVTIGGKEAAGASIADEALPVAEKDPFEVTWDGGDADPLCPRSINILRKWLIVGITCLGAACV